MAGNARKIQTSFTTGEISPRLLARVDLDSYENATKTMENVYPLPHGGAKRRPGSIFVGAVKDGTEDARLVPFVFSRTNAYILVLNADVMQFVKDGAFIEDGGSRVEIAIPWAEIDLPFIDYAQSGSVMFFTHPDVSPRILERASDISWVLTPMVFTFNAISDAWYYSAYLNFKLITSGDGFKVNDNYRIVTNGSGGITSQSWTTRTGTGDITGIDIYADNDPGGGQTWNILCTFATDQRQEFTVTGSVTGQPTAQWTTTSYPKSVSFYEQRLYFGGTDRDPQTIWGSGIADYFNLTVGPNSDDGVNFTIASNRYDEIIHLEAARSLMPLTYGGEFSLTGGDLGITPTAAVLRGHTFHGTKHGVKPQRIGEEVLFCQKDGKKVRAISYDVTIDGNVAADLTILAEHITGIGAGILDMSYMQDPDSILWAIRDDGVLLSLTHLRSQSVTAWSRHITQGSYSNVSTIPEGSTDTTYLIVDRTVNSIDVRYVEYFDYDTYTDSGLHGVTTSATDTWAGLDHLEGETVKVRADGKVHPDVTVASGQIVLDYTAEEIEVGLGFESTIELLHPEVVFADGTGQGSQLRVFEAVLRLQETVGLSVNGKTVPIHNTQSLMDTAPVPFTGDKDVRLVGWSSPNNIQIQQTLPAPFTLLGVILKITVGSQ